MFEDSTFTGFELGIEHRPWAATVDVDENVWIDEREEVEQETGEPPQ